MDSADLFVKSAAFFDDFVPQSSITTLRYLLALIDSERGTDSPIRILRKSLNLLMLTQTRERRLARQGSCARGHHAGGEIHGP